MIHIFSDRVKIVTNIKTGEVKAVKDGSVMYTQMAGSVESYTQLLINTAKDAERLNQFNN
ncbi:MAG: hypothetical protein LIP01_14895 [Tannerellaceae bacterium]|nr:hypothetical protein [Tannerellaceae bacterium]